MKFFIHIASLFYLGLIKLRLLGYRFKFLKQHVFDTPVVSVGNITVGGTGKTPMIIYLSQLLTKKNIKHAIVSRGYKKLARGTIVVQDYDKKHINNPTIAGDEPVMLTYKLENIPIIVDSNKVRGISLAIEKFCPQIILLDDGFQSLYIDKKKDCVLVDSSLSIKHYQLIPRGRLREPLLALERSDFVIFMSKGIVNNSIKEIIVPMLNKHTIPYLNASFKPKLYKHNYNTRSLEKQNNKEMLSQPCVAIVGIANTQSFLDLVDVFCKNVFDSCVFPDHYNYQKNEEKFDAMLGACEKKSGERLNITIITTLKDYVKIVQLPCVQLKKYSLYIIDINIITDNDNKLLELILGEGRKG